MAQERNLQPTPTQAENDAAARGELIDKKEYDGSPLQPGAMPKPELPPGERPELPSPVEAPVISALDPNTAVVGGPDLVMTVNGSGFTADSMIVWNGGDEPTTFISDAQVMTGVKPSTASGPYTVLIGVRNGDKLSNELPFSFTEEAPVARSKTKK